MTFITEVYDYPLSKKEKSQRLQHYLAKQTTPFARNRYQDPNGIYNRLSSYNLEPGSNSSEYRSNSLREQKEKDFKSLCQLSISEFYQDIWHLLLNRKSGIISKNTCIELVSSKQNKVVIRVWLENNFPITFMALVDQEKDEQVIDCYADLFGSLTLLIMPNTNNKFKSLALNYKSIDDIQNLSLEVMAQISAQLFEGQMLNLSTLVNYGFTNASSQAMRKNSSIFRSICPYEQHLHDFFRYLESTPNGSSMISERSSETIYGLHQTTPQSKHEIISQSILKVSKSGCIGSGIYCTKVLTLNGKLIVGGHTESLFMRAARNNNLSINKLPATNRLEMEKQERYLTHLQNNTQLPAQTVTTDYLLLSCQRPGNLLTNWIERLGNGRLYLEARSRLLKSKRSYLPLEKRESKTKLAENYFAILSAECVKSYSALFYFLTQTIKVQMQLPRSKVPFHQTSSEYIDAFLILFNNTRRLIPALLNNILFEITKDYILLHLRHENTNKWKKIQSFDMDLFYEIIFALSPEDMRINWDSAKFSPDFSELIACLSQYEGFHEQGFCLFFVERLLFYFNNRILEGRTSLPHPFLIEKFDDLAKTLPNLAGLLHHFTAAQKYKYTHFFEDYLHYLRESELESFSRSKIRIPVKAGTFGTEELIFHSQSSKIKVFDFEFQSTKIDNTYYQELIRKEEYSLSISTSPSKSNGFTVRAPTKQESSHSFFSTPMQNKTKTNTLVDFMCFDLNFYPENLIEGAINPIEIPNLLLDELKKNTYLRRLYLSHSQTFEGYTLEQHTLMNMNAFITYFYLEMMKNAKGMQRALWFLKTLAIHDIGKPLGTSDEQHGNTLVIINKLPSSYLNTQDKRLSMAICGTDFLGTFLIKNAGLSTDKKLFDTTRITAISGIYRMAAYAQLDYQTFLCDYLIPYYQCGTLSYSEHAHCTINGYLTKGQLKNTADSNYPIFSTVGQVWLHQKKQYSDETNYAVLIASLKDLNDIDLSQLVIVTKRIETAIGQLLDKFSHLTEKEKLIIKFSGELSEFSINQRNEYGYHLLNALEDYFLLPDIEACLSENIHSLLTNFPPRSKLANILESCLFEKQSKNLDCSIFSQNIV